MCIFNRAFDTLPVFNYLSKKIFQGSLDAINQDIV